MFKCNRIFDCVKHLPLRHFKPVKSDIIVLILTKLCYVSDMIVSLNTPSETLSGIAALMREGRLVANMTQEQLAGQANVSLAVLRKFERTGKISLESFVKLAFVLGLSDRLLEALRMKTETASLDDILKDISGPKRKRASPARSPKHDQGRGNRQAAR